MGTARAGVFLEFTFLHRKTVRWAIAADEGPFALCIQFLWIHPFWDVAFLDTSNIFFTFVKPNNSNVSAML
jgi:hypothetical protein